MRLVTIYYTARKFLTHLFKVEKATNITNVIYRRNLHTYFYYTYAIGTAHFRGHECCYMGVDLLFINRGSTYIFPSRKLNTIENMLCQHKCQPQTDKIMLTARLAR